MFKEGVLVKVGEMVSEIFEEFIEEKYLGVIVKVEENKVRFGVVYNGKEYGFGFFSGGERIVLGFVFRFVFFLYFVGEISLFIFDELMLYFDEERRRRFVDIM